MTAIHVGPEQNGQKVNLHGGEIAAVYEIMFAGAAHQPLVLKVYPEICSPQSPKEPYV